jgi:hypothetical protein
MRTLEPIEREVHISYSDDSDEAQIDTLNRPAQRKLLKLCEKRPDEIRCYGTYRKDDLQPLTFYCPKSWVHIRPPKHTSERQREAARANIQKARETISQKA